MWFDFCVSNDEVRQTYRRLAKQYHPDMGGDTATMQSINAEYAYVSARFVRSERPGRTEQEYASYDAVSENIRVIILMLLKLEGLRIEICGNWVWVDGDTKQHREALKGLGLRWASKKLKWYYAGVPAGFHRRTWSMDKIRSRYGSRLVREEDE